MVIHIGEKSYLVLRTLPGEDGHLAQLICRDTSEKSERVYRAVKLPSGQVHGGLVRYLMEQVQNKSFREFVDYATEADGLTVLMDCGLGRPLSERLQTERFSLAERLELSRRLLEHLILSDFPVWFVVSALGPERVKVTEAMDFGFDFDLSGIADFESATLPAALGRIADTLSAIFSPELSRRAFPDMESLLYRLKHGEFESLLAAYQELLGICRIWMDRDEERLESKSLSFRVWERIKGLGRFLKTFAKAAVVLLAAAYLGYSIYQFTRPDPVREVYQKIGELEVRNHAEAETE